MVIHQQASHTRKERLALMTAVTPPRTEEAILIEQLRGQLLVALSLLVSLGFDMTDLTDYLWT